MRFRARFLVSTLAALTAFLPVGCSQIAGIAQLTLAAPSDDGGPPIDGASRPPADASPSDAGDGSVHPSDTGPIPLTDAAQTLDATLNDGGNGPSDAHVDSHPDAAFDAGPDPVVTVSAGYDHACALTKSGRVLCWGSNDNLQLGHSPTVDVTCMAGTSGSGPCNATPMLVDDSSGKPLSGVQKISSGWDFSCVLLGDAAVACWGSNLYGRLGHDASIDLSCGGDPCNETPTNVVGLGGVGDIATSDETPDVCATTDAGVFCWGFDGDGVFGNGAACNTDAAVQASSPTSSLVTTKASLMSIGGSTACVAVGDGAVSCWGRNFAGELGHAWDAGVPPDQIDLSGTNCNGTPQPVKGLISPVELASGDSFNCSLGTDQSIACWGLNYFGTLGLGAPDEYAHPGPTTITGLMAVEISARSEHICARGSTGALRCWGANDFGELGNGVVGTAAVDAGPDAAGDAAVDAGNCLLAQVCVNGTPTLVPDLPGTMSAVAAGWGASFAVTADGGVFAWGLNDRGQLGHAPGSGDVACDTALQGFCNAHPQPVAGLPPPM